MHLLESRDLPDDFFEEIIEQLVDRDKRLTRLNSDDVQHQLSREGAHFPEISSLATVDMVEQELIVGYKNPQEPRYIVYNDMQPSIEVFKWARGYYDGKDKAFPMLSVGKPLIPHSRYAKASDFETVDQHMLARGFRIINPTIPQSTSYEPYCDQEERVSLFYRIRNIVEARLWKQERKQDNVNQVISIQPRKDIICSVFCEEMICVSSQVAEFVKTTMRGVELISMTRGRYRRTTSVKYYTRCYDERYSKFDSPVIGFDYNPYSPYGNGEILSVVMSSTGISYKREWKDTMVKGFFFYKFKRYHSDVWYNCFFSNEHSYNRALMSMDMVTNSFFVFERDIIVKDLVKPMELFVKPLAIDPFVILPRYENKMKYLVRSALRYKLDSVIDIRSIDGTVFVPYMTRQMQVVASKEVVSSQLDQEDVSRVILSKVWAKPVDKILIQESKSLTDVLPEEFSTFVSNRITWYNQGFFSEEDYLDHVKQCQQYFIQKYFVYKTSGKQVKSNSNYKKKKKNDKSLIISRYRIWRVTKKKEKESQEFEFVPYAIFRYPSNRWGSLVYDFFSFTLEEFLSQRSLIRDMIRDPPWLYDRPDSSSMPIEFDQRAMGIVSRHMNEVEEVYDTELDFKDKKNKEIDYEGYVACYQPSFLYPRVLQELDRIRLGDYEQFNSLDHVRLNDNVEYTVMGNAEEF